MGRGRILLWADSLIESRVVTSFLLAEDYDVVEYSAAERQSSPDGHQLFDLGILIVSRGDSILESAEWALRQASDESGLPIIAIVESQPVQPATTREVLIRPIRLAELARRVRDKIDERWKEEPFNPSL